MRKHVFTLFKNMDDKLFHLMLACPRKTAVDRELLLKGVDIYHIDLDGEFSPLMDLKAIGQLLYIIRENGVRLLHTHGAKAGIVGRTAAVLAGVPVVLSTVHNFVYQGRVSRVQKLLYSLIERGLSRFTDHYITVSRALAEEIKSLDGIPAEKISVIYNGVDLKSFNMMLDCTVKKRELGLDPYAPVVGTAGRLVSTKGISYFIRAAAEIKEVYPRTQFLVIGDGPERGKLESMARDFHLYPNIKFLGYRRDFPGLLPLINVFVVPSISEGLSIVTLEAMAARRPVVAFEVGGIPEIITNNRTGILVPVVDSSYLARAVIGLLKYPSRAERLGNCARDVVEEKFDHGLMVKRTEEVYRRCLEQKGVILEPAFGT